MKYDINLPTLVSVIGQELKDRDEQMLRTAVTAGNSVGGIGGALRYLNERMYQFWVYPTPCSNVGSPGLNMTCMIS